MNLLESKLNSIAAIALDTSLNSARLDYVNENFYNKSYVISALNNKQASIVEAPATVSLGQPADYTYFIDSTSVSYPLFNSKDIIWTKFNNNISFVISEGFRNAYLTTTSASLLYQLSGEYITDASLFQLSGDYITNAPLFQLSGNYITNASLFQLSGNYLTDASVFQLAGNYLTTFTPLSGIYLSIINADNTYQKNIGYGILFNTNYFTKYI